MKRGGNKMQWTSKGDGTISISVSYEKIAKWNMCIYTSSLVWRFEKLFYFIIGIHVFEKLEDAGWEEKLSNYPLKYKTHVLFTSDDIISEW